MPVPTLVSDFTGPDENPLSEGGNWANLNTSGFALQRTSNQARSTSNPAASYWTPANFGPDLEAYCTIPTIGGAGIAVRVQGEGGAATWDGYLVTVAASSCQISSVTNASTTTLVNVAQTWASGDKMGIRCEGSTHQVWRQASGSGDWNLVRSVVDTTYPSAGKIGLRCGDATVRLDDFYAGTDTDMFGPNAPVYYIKG